MDHNGSTTSVRKDVRTDRVSLLRLLPGAPNVSPTDVLLTLQQELRLRPEDYTLQHSNDIVIMTCRAIVPYRMRSIWRTPRTLLNQARRPFASKGLLQVV